MTNFNSWQDPSSEPVNDIEAIVRAAGGYVQASDDLRPRVLETSRTERGEQRARRCLRQVAFFVVLLGVFVPAGAERPNTADARHLLPLVSIDAETIFSRAESNAAHGSELSWGMVEAFTELRREQADALRIAL